MGIKDLIKNQILFFDGAMGTMLQKRGLKLGENPEIYNIEQGEIIRDIHIEYIQSGANIITTNTFGANERKLKNTGYTVEEIIDKAVTKAKEAINITKIKGQDTFIALDIGPIGELLEPMGTLGFDDAYEIFKRQVIQGEKSGVDIILIETMTDLYEMKAAILAAKENSKLPIFSTMSFEENGRTFTGCTPESLAITLEGLGVTALGINCSLGPKEIIPIMKKVVENTNLPIIVQPNAGLPSVNLGQVSYNILPDEFANEVEKLVSIGVGIVGGCCGTTPEYIKILKERLKDKSLVERSVVSFSAICTPSKVVKIDGVKVIGERINPTGKKLFKEALRNNDINYILNQAIEQIEAGAEILDVNVGLPEIVEEEKIVEVIKEIQAIIDVPLQIDSSNYNAIEKALRYYNGKPIVNSVNGEEKVLEKILPLIKKYGAAVVGLTLNEKGIPMKADERFEIADKILTKAIDYGIKKEDVFIDTLVLTASAQQAEVRETLKALKLVNEKLGLKTVLGVSNISFGLPKRDIINQTFLALALENGLNLPILNPNSKGMMDVINSFNVLYNYDENSKKYIEKYGQKQEEKEVKLIKQEIQDYDLQRIVIKGLKEYGAKATEYLLNKYDELTIVNNFLIPALDEVGRKFECGEVFLPQLIQSAETAKFSFEILKKNLTLKQKDSILKGKIVLATVKGDIHDIGKNIVKVILENYGYEIIDLGKDVAPQRVIDVIVENDITLVGLSALMTTTLKSMEETITEIRKLNRSVKVFVGGAVLTNEYAKMIGADFYARDAKESVNIAKKHFSVI